MMMDSHKGGSEYSMP